MRPGLAFAFLIGCVAAACARQPSPSEQRANTPHAVTLVGCIESGGKEGGVVLRGRDVAGTTGTGVGREPGGLPSTASMPGGDEDRFARPGTTIEGRASMLTPRLESASAGDLQARIGQRALVRGDFEPAGLQHSYDTVKVASIETIAPTCSQP